MGDLYVIDEAVFPYVAEGILKNGAPFYYNGELRPADFGLWHPPLYDYLLAGFVGLFGFSPFSVRAFGLVCVLISIFVLFLVLRRIMPRAPQIAYVALSALVLWSPQVVSGALIPDIDGSFGFLVVALGIWLAAVVKQDTISPRLALLIVGFATLSVATKFTITGFIALIVGVAALLSQGQQWKKALTVVVGFVVGTAVALGLLVLGGVLIGYDARLPFDYVFVSVSSRTPGRGGLSGAIATLLDGPGSTLVWVGPSIVLAALVAAVVLAVRRGKEADSRFVVLLASAGVFIVLGYAVISASPFQFPKYTPIVVPMFALAATTLLSVVPKRSMAGFRTPRGRWVAAASVGILIAGAAGMFGLLTHDERVDGRSLWDLTVLSAACLVAVAVVFAVALLLVRPVDDEGSIVNMRSLISSSVALALLVTPVMVQASAATVNATAQYSTRYYYGERGMNSFVEDAEKIVPEGTPIIGPKDVGFQISRPFYEDAILFSWTVDKFRSFVEDKRVPFIVTRKKHDYSEAIYPAYFAVIREFYKPVLDSPDIDFVLWEIKSN
ncbi:MAG: hypothetical protein BGN98_05675 [Microbacterium sp. 69-7]|uniref:ArnT family glycosyltransferase n=1 Tax=Microbacterium sp. 69-7 TaxID=1895784 RepID=UPI00092B5A65|nr:glycosyltransferase family 39 protein [Microbacterium sp. 69-7]OJU43470.1 MAG: hypothetical protein BGN98_05675 [Microbacterium sp. 69-7]OJX65658.1 MAG: hypothetical protein BGO95_08820 [Micrococcales bacterium 73-13]